MIIDLIKNEVKRMQSRDQSRNNNFSSRIFITLTGLLFGATLLLSGCGKPDEAKTVESVRPAKIMTVSSDAGGLSRRFPGIVRASQRVDLSFRVSGPLIELSIIEGQAVKKGDLIARIDPRDFETNLKKIESSINQARARLESMLTGARPEDLRILEAEVTAAKARWVKARQQYERYRDLYARNQVSKADYDLHRSNQEVAKATLDTARQNLEKGKTGARKEDIEAQRATISGLEAKRKGARDALNDTRLKAPFSGVIADRYVENYQDVQAKQPVVSLQDVSSIEILVDVPEIMMATVKDKNALNVFAEFASIPGKKYRTTLKEFSTKADPQTRTYRVVLKMPAPKEVNILPGMTAKVFRIIDPGEVVQESAFLVPIEAVFGDEAGKQYVWIVNPETTQVQKREVQVGNVTGGTIRILEGLTSGEKIVTAGVNFLQPGMKVRAIKGTIGG